VGGRQLSINPSQYGTVDAGNAILDSGTTFSILPNPFVPAILNLVRQVPLPSIPSSWSSLPGPLCSLPATWTPGNC